MLRLAYLLVLLIVPTTSSPAFAKHPSHWRQKNIPVPHNFVVGYGSLVNPASRARTLGEESATAIPIRISAEFGYRRVWNYRVTNMSTALGLEKAKPQDADTINGVLYAISDNDIDALDKRERSYDRIKIPWECIESLSWLRLPDVGDVWIYVPKADSVQLPTLNEPIIQTYIDLTMEGFLSYSEAFAAEFVETTYYWPQFWINDRLMARRPWEYTPEFSYIDRLLKKYLPQVEGESLFEERRYPAEYSMMLNWAR